MIVCFYMLAIGNGSESTKTDSSSMEYRINIEFLINIEINIEFFFLYLLFIELFRICVLYVFICVGNGSESTKTDHSSMEYRIFN